MLKKIKVIEYELLGNDDGGWDCNNLYEICSPFIVDIPADASDNQIIHLLNGHAITVYQFPRKIEDTLKLSELEADNNICSYDMIELVERSTGKPVGRLELEDLSDQEIIEYVDSLTVDEINAASKIGTYENQYGYCYIAIIGDYAMAIASITNVGIIDLDCVEAHTDISDYASIVEAYLKEEFLKDYEIFILPAYWASYLINGDASGYTDDEIAEIDTFCGDKGCCIGCSDDSWFSWRNDVNKLGGDVKEFYFQRVENKE